MSKSAGNVVLLEDIIERGLDPLSLRFALLENRYRSQMDLTWESLEAAHVTLKRFRRLMAQLGSSNKISADSEITKALMTDLDTPRAMQRLRTVEKDKEMAPEIKRGIFIYADQVLALDLARIEERAELPHELSLILKERDKARNEKNWQESDRLRQELEKNGLVIKDLTNGQEWDWA